MPGREGHAALQVTNIMRAIFGLCSDRRRRTSGSVNAHLGGGAVGDLYLVSAYLYLLFMIVKAHTLFIE